MSPSGLVGRVGALAALAVRDGLPDRRGELFRIQPGLLEPDRSGRALVHGVVAREEHRAGTRVRREHGCEQMLPAAVADHHHVEGPLPDFLFGGVEAGHLILLPHPLDCCGERWLR